MNEEGAWGLFALIVLALVGWGTISHIGATNNGQHTGYVTAVEQEGLIWKTWRAYVKTDPQSSQEDSYCITDVSSSERQPITAPDGKQIIITDPTLVSQLQDAEKNRVLVTVNYASPWLVWKWQCGGESSIIKSIQTQTSPQGCGTNDPLCIRTNASSSTTAGNSDNKIQGGSTYRGIKLPN